MTNGKTWLQQVMHENSEKVENKKLSNAINISDVDKAFDKVWRKCEQAAKKGKCRTTMLLLFQDLKEDEKKLLEVKKMLESRELKVFVTMVNAEFNYIEYEISWR